MLTFWRSNRFAAVSLLIVIVASFIAFTGCSKEPEWMAVNKKLIQENNIKERVRTDIPDTKIKSNLPVF